MRKIVTYIGSLVLIAGLFTACKKETRQETFGRINAEVLQNSKAYATLGEATSLIGHRLTGSDNGHKAEEYTFNKFKEYGFEDVKFQEFEVFRRQLRLISNDGNDRINVFFESITVHKELELFFLAKFQVTEKKE